MNKLMLNDLLGLTPSQIATGKINLTNGGGNKYYNPDEKARNRGMDFSYGNKAHRTRLNIGDLVVNCLRQDGEDDWLLIDVSVIVDEKPQSTVYSGETLAVGQPIERYRPLFGRLRFTVEKKRGTMGFRFNLSTFIDTAVVTSLSREEQIQKPQA